MLPFNRGGLPYAKALATMHALCFSKVWSEKDFTDMLSLSTTRAYLNDKAFVLFSVCGEQAEILTLGVVPDFRKKGVALSLLNFSTEKLKNEGVKEIFLDVNVNNLPARKLYEHADFKQISIRKDYYDEDGKKSDALILKKTL